VAPQAIYSSQNCEVTRLFEKNASPELKQVFRAKLLLLQMFFKKQKQVTRKKIIVLSRINQQNALLPIFHTLTSKKVKASI